MAGIPYRAKWRVSFSEECFLLMAENLDKIHANENAFKFSNAGGMEGGGKRKATVHAPADLIKQQMIQGRIRWRRACKEGNTSRQKDKALI